MNHSVQERENHGNHGENCLSANTFQQKPKTHLFMQRQTSFDVSRHFLLSKLKILTICLYWQRCFSFWHEFSQILSSGSAAHL